jgi:hypothetical protein
LTPVPPMSMQSVRVPAAAAVGDTGIERAGVITGMCRS